MVAEYSAMPQHVGRLVYSVLYCAMFAKYELWHVMLPNYTAMSCCVGKTQELCYDLLVDRNVQTPGFDEFSSVRAALKHLLSRVLYAGLLIMNRITDIKHLSQTIIFINVCLVLITNHMKNIKRRGAARTCMKSGNHIKIAYPILRHFVASHISEQISRLSQNLSATFQAVSDKEI